MMSDFQVDEQVIWTSPHTKERVSMSFRGKTGLTFCCLYNFDTGMQVIAPLSEVEHDWRRMCEVEETAHAQTRTELAYVMQERNEYLERAEAAEARAAALEKQLEAVTTQYNTLQEMYRADHDQRIRQEEQIKQLNSEIEYLRSTDHAADLAFERMAPLDWRDAYGLSDETPLGQALDGLGDEVEP